MRFVRIAWALLIGAFGTARAQSSPEASPRPRLEVRTRGNQQTFRIGEAIPLELQFSSAAENKYHIETRSSDRTGRLDLEAYAVEPRSGWRDPLGLYFRTAEIIGGGLESSQILGGEAFPIAADLNEWVRFEQPGQYRVTITSWRVFESSPSSPLALVSSPVLLTIVAPTPEWQQETFRRAAAVLAQSYQISTLLGLPSPQGRRDAMRVLRFLGTAEAARELAHRIDDRDCGRDCLLGLAGSPAREVAFQELRKVLPDSRHAHEIRWTQLMSVLGAPEDPGDK